MNLSARFTSGLTPSQRLFLRRNGPVFAVYGFIVILFLIGATQSERFMSVRNLTNVARQSAFLGIVALGQMLVILTAGIDLSVGSLVKLSIFGLGPGDEWRAGQLGFCHPDHPGFGITCRPDSRIPGE